MNHQLKETNILFLINNLNKGGAEKVFVEEVNSLDKQGYKVWLGLMYASGHLGFKDSLALEQSKIQELVFRSMYDLRGLVRLHRFIRQKNISIIYSTLEESNVIARVIGILMPHIRVFIREANDARTKVIKFKCVDMLLNFVPEKIIAVSRGVKESLVKYQPFYSKKIVVLENGVRVEDINYEEMFSRKSNDEITILNVGSLTRQKNQTALLKVFKKAVEQQPHLRIMIVGDGELQSKLNRFLVDNNLEKKAHLVESLDWDGLQHYYQNAHFFVLSSLWEGCPNVLLEAMSHGLPVVSTKVGGAEDIIRDGSSGFLVNITDSDLMYQKVIQLVQDKKLRHDIGLAARRRVEERYSFERHLSSLVHILS